MLFRSDVTIVSGRPSLLVTELVEGQPLSYEWASELRVADVEHVADDLGLFLTRLHSIPAATVLADLPVVEPTPQSNTARLRERFPALVDDPRAVLVRSWCDWVDDTLGRPNPLAPVVVHGDLHGHNQIWGHGEHRLAAVVDFEESGIAEPEFDLRYLPSNSANPLLAVAIVAAYERLCGRNLSIDRMMAWNVLTHLGDALWRTEAGAPLPGGGTAPSWVDDLATRFERFEVSPGCRPPTRRASLER